MSQYARFGSLLLLIVVGIPAVLSAAIGFIGFLFLLIMSGDSGTALSLGSGIGLMLIIILIVFSFPAILIGTLFLGAHFHFKGRYAASITTTLSVILVLGALGTAVEGHVPLYPSDWLGITPAIIATVSSHVY